MSAKYASGARALTGLAGQGVWRGWKPIGALAILATCQRKKPTIPSIHVVSPRQAKMSVAGVSKELWHMVKRRLDPFYFRSSGDMNYSDLKAHVLQAIGKLETFDEDLFVHDASEWAIAHRLAVYLEQEIPGWNVDCEYNRQGLHRNPKETSSGGIYGLT